jgi:NMD protein affecting ribosome stability and mRNA decay
MIDYKDRKKNCPRCGKQVPTYSKTCYDCDWDFGFKYGKKVVGKKRCPKCREMIPDSFEYHTCGWKF